MKGLSSRNLKYVRCFAEACPDLQSGQQCAAQLLWFHISTNGLSRIEVTIPGAVEQVAIAAVLSDMDAEIAALEAHRKKTRALKQGMTQELLTGRIRLI